MRKMKEIQDYIKRKRRKRAIRKLVMIITMATIALVLFLTKAPIFNIKQIVFKGAATITQADCLERIKDRIGMNIFRVNEKQIKEDLLKNKYLKSVNVSRKGLNTLEISIVEEAPVFYIVEGENKKIISEDLNVVEVVQDISGRNLVEIIGLDASNCNVGDKINSDDVYSKVLKTLYPYIADNHETIKFDSIDISNIVDIKGYMGEVEIFIGDDSNIHSKMENIYRIMLADNINLKKGYIDVSFEGSPVIKNNSN